MVSSKTILLSALSVLSSTVVAQTPPGFSPSQQEPLGVTFANNNNVSPAGELIPRADTASPPALTSIALGQSTTGLVLMVDLDVNSGGSRVPLLHWLAPGVTPILSSANGASLNVPVPSSNGAVYRQPTPPAGDIAHRYVLLLFTQPNNFVLPSTYSNLADNRVNFNYQQFITDLRLGSPLAAQYFTVQNTTAAASGSATSSAASVVSSAASSASSVASSARSSGSSAVSSAASSASRAASSATSAAVATATANAAPGVKGQGSVFGLVAAALFALW